MIPELERRPGTSCGGQLQRFGGVVAATLIIATAGCSSSSPTAVDSLAPPFRSGSADGTRQPTDAAAALAQLPVKGRAPKTGYNSDTREELFPHWSDLDGDGCDTRAETLARDAVPGTTVLDGGGCVVGAAIDDPYTGGRIVEETGEGSAVDIDHVVALGDAWQKGAQPLTADQREQFANDPLNVLAVDDHENRGKGDGDSATWLPPNRAYRCAYVARQVAVKLRYGLWVTSAERDAIARLLDGCPGEPLPA